MAITHSRVPVPSARPLQSTEGLAPYTAEAHLGTFLSSGPRWPPGSRKPLQTEALFVNPCPKVAPPPASLL